MDLTALFILLLKGFFIGFAIAAPVGAVAILCIRRTLAHHIFLASLTGLGSACADAFYSMITAFSLASISKLILEYDFYLKLFGGVLLFFFGFSILLSHGRQESQENMKDSPLHTFTSAFVLTISNPITLFAFAAAFTATGISPYYESFIQALLLVVGVFCGACTWWLSLITVISFMKHKLSDTQLHWINWFSGAILLVFATSILASLVLNLQEIHL
jgi:threonine/homoserine/homoserine lactone efflux protein